MLVHALRRISREYKIALDASSLEPRLRAKPAEEGIRETRQRGLRHFGTLRHKGVTCTYEAKMYDEGSRFGIEGGRIGTFYVKERDS